MQQLNVFGFGHLRLQYADAEITTFPTRHVEELLSYLLVHRNVPHHREKLIELLWPRTATSRARPRFSTVLWRLRSLLGDLSLTPDDYLQVNRQTVAFVPGSTWFFDIVSFEDALRRAARAPDAAQREEALRQALETCRGEPFEGLYANWCLRERERLARLQLRAMGQLMSLLMQRKAYHEAILCGQEILEADPLREEVHRALMFCFWRSGEHASAAQQYEACAVLLEEELQIRPMAQTVELQQRIVRDRLRLSAAQLPEADPLRQEIESAFVTFQSAAATLNALLTAAETQPDR